MCWVDPGNTVQARRKRQGHLPHFSQVNSISVPQGGTGTLVLRMSLPWMGNTPSRDPPCTWCSLLSDSLSREEAFPHPSFRQVPGEPDALLRRWASKLATHAKEVVPEPTTGSCRSSCGGGVFLGRTSVSWKREAAGEMGMGSRVWFSGRRLY